MYLHLTLYQINIYNKKWRNFQSQQNILNSFQTRTQQANKDTFKQNHTQPSKSYISIWHDARVQWSMFVQTVLEKNMCRNKLNVKPKIRKKNTKTNYLLINYKYIYFYFWRKKPKTKKIKCSVKVCCQIYGSTKRIVFYQTETKKKQTNKIK